jgi:hypothetical protein
MADIFAIPDRMLEKQHKKLLAKLNDKIFDGNRAYDAIISTLQAECNRFPNTSMAWPSVLKRKGNAIELQIKIVNTLSHPNGAKYQQSMQYYGRPPAVVAHRRIVDGSLYEMAEQSLAIIRATKTISEVLTALEATKCSEADSNT